MIRNFMAIVMGGISLLSLVACDSETQLPVDGGTCSYRDVVGSATIVSIEDVTDASVEPCQGPKKVKFSFEADATSLMTSSVSCRSTACYPKNQIASEYITVVYGFNPPQQWLTEEGITVGSHHRVIKRELLTGTCTPVIYQFLDLDFERAEAMCMGSVRRGGE